MTESELLVKSRGQKGGQVAEADLIAAIATSRPRSTAERLAVAGIGAGKTAQYGEAIVSLIRQTT